MNSSLPKPDNTQEQERSCTCHPDDNPPTPCAKQYALDECRQSAGLQDYAPASDTELTQSVSMRVWIAKMLNSMTLDELEVVRASVDFVLDSRKSSAKGIDDGMATD